MESEDVTDDDFANDLVISDIEAEIDMEIPLLLPRVELVLLATARAVIGSNSRDWWRQ